MAASASMFIVIAPDPVNYILTDEIIDDFERITGWAGENGVKIHSVVYNYVADGYPKFSRILENIQNIQKVILVDKKDASFLQILFCKFLKEDCGKKIFYYSGHGKHICKVERKGFQRLPEQEAACVEHERQYGTEPLIPTEEQMEPGHDDMDSSDTMAAAVEWIRYHGNCKTQETLWIQSGPKCEMEYVDDSMAADIARCLPNDNILYLVFDCCHAEGILNTWQVHGPSGHFFERQKKVVLFAASATERMTPSGFTESFCKHAKFGRKMYEIGKNIGDDMFRSNKDMFSITKYSLEDLCIVEF